MSTACCGTLALALYRFYALSGKIAIFESKYSIPILFLLSILVAVPTIVVQRMATLGQTEEGVLSMIKEKAPQYIFIVEQGFCSSFKTPLLGLIFAVVYGIEISIIEVSGLLYTIKTVKLLREVKSSLSAATYSVQKQFILSIFIQFMIPLITLVIPVIIFFFIQLFKLENAVGELVIFLNKRGIHNFLVYAEIAVHLMTLHAPLNGSAILFTIRPYKDAIKRGIRILIWKKDSVSSNNIIATTNASLSVRH